MAHVLADRVQETTATTGTGTLTLAGASSGYRTFAAVGNGNTTDIFIVDGSAWEVAKLCTYTSSGTTLTRGTFVASSTGSVLNLSGSAVVGVGGRAELLQAVYDHLLNLAANKILGQTGSPGAAVAIDCTAAGRALLDDADAAAQRVTLGLGSAATMSMAYVQARDVKAANTDGGTATAGSWATRTITEITDDSASIASLSSNQVTLPAGTYRFHASAAFLLTNQTQIRLYNATDSSVIKYGLNTYCYQSAGDGSCSPALAYGRFTIAGSKALRIEYRVLRTQTTNGLGAKMNVSGDEVYLTLEFWKE